MLENACNLNIMTLVSHDMTLLINDMSFCPNIHIQKTSCYDKNVIAQWRKSESAGYVKVKLIAGPLTSARRLGSKTQWRKQKIRRRSGAASGAV